MQPRLILFARHPHYGQGKTRLAADIGKREALRWYRGHLHGMIRRLYAPRRWQLLLALEAAPTQLAQNAFPLETIQQGPGDLGQRMLRCLAITAPGPRLLIGSDILDVSQTDIAHLFQALQHGPNLLAPSPDGGFWALGRRGSAVPARHLRNVSWSHATTASQTQAALGRCRIIPLLRNDVDTLADLP